VLGVDGCREGWVVVALEDGAFAGASRVDTFDEVMALGESAHAVGVDMPIGLVARGARTCDKRVQAELGPRRSSVFAVPPRSALMEASYADANAACARLAGFGLSKQLWNLKAKIVEVDASLARARRRARVVPPDGRREAQAVGVERVVEVHPEASFRELAGAPLADGKKSYDGVMRRLALLEGAGIVMPRVLSIGRVGVDDVLDAAAAAWSARRVALGAARRLPDTGPEQRDRGRTVAIWI